MSDDLSLKDSLLRLIQALDVDNDVKDSIQSLMAQAVFPAVAAKVIIDNLETTFESINAENESILGFRIDEIDFLKALHRLIPAKIKELQKAKEEEDAGVFVDTGNAS